MNLAEFAAKYHLKVKKDSCDDLLIPGRVKDAKRVEDNHHIYQGLLGSLIVYFNFPSVGRWNSVRKKLDQPGVFPLKLLKYEGYFGFDPENELLVKLILKLAKIRVKRQLTPEQKAKIQARFTKK